MKELILKSASDAKEYLEIISKSASLAYQKISELSEAKSGMEIFEEMKFKQIGYDPLIPDRPLNIIEQVNQTFTYLASFKAVEIIFDRHPSLSNLSLNLGTVSGTDIESKELGGIAAEVFAATKPSSNNKLNKDIVKVTATEATYKYVFFMCPNFEPGYYKEKSTNEVAVWSLGL